MAENNKLRVELCMGSSCFARGNSGILSDLEGFISENGLEDRVELEGHLCLGKCNSGPHITIGDKEFSGNRCRIQSTLRLQAAATAISA